MKILFLSFWFPYPPNFGYKIRVFNQIKELSKDNEVHLICFSNFEKNNISELKNYCTSIFCFEPTHYNRKMSHVFLGFFKKDPRYFSTSFTPEAKKVVDEVIVNEDINIILAGGTGVAEYVLDIKDIPKALDLHNVDSALYKTIAQNRPTILKKIRAYLFWLKFLGYERKVCEQFDLCIVVSDKEKEHLLKNVPKAKTMVLPNAIDLKLYNVEKKEEPNTIIFTGTLTYEANLDAINWFYDSIFPLVKEQKPDVKLIITGDHSKVNVEHLSSDPNVILTGHVKDIYSLIAESAISIAPIRIGGGSRFKILESMALGTPVVSTTIGAEGIAVTDGENILIADDRKEFAQKTVDLLNNYELRSKISKNARNLVGEKYNWNTLGYKLNQSLLEIIKDNKS